MQRIINDIRSELDQLVTDIQEVGDAALLQINCVRLAENYRLMRRLETALAEGATEHV